jgi:hypothetical protein
MMQIARPGSAGRVKNGRRIVLLIRPDPLGAP